MFVNTVPGIRLRREIRQFLLPFPPAPHHFGVCPLPPYFLSLAFPFMADTPSVSVVIPCLNEEATIGEVVEQARQALDRFGYRGEVVVVDNDSTDQTAARAREAGARVIEEPQRGYGHALRAGLAAAGGQYIVVADGDGTYDLEILNRFVEPLRAAHDMVLGTRRNGHILPGAMGWLHRHILEPIQTWLLRRFFNFRVSDVRCGLRSMTRPALERMDLSARGAEASSEMILEAVRLRLETVEVPVRFHPREGESRRSGRDFWRVVRYIFLLSPTHLFVLPGLLMLVVGLALEGSLLAGPIWIGSLPLDFHFMFLGGALAILGLQLLLLGIYTKTYYLLHGPAELMDPWIRSLHGWYRLRYGLLVGGGLFGAGVALDLWLLVKWLLLRSSSFFEVRPAMLALTLMILGAEIVFASFFLSTLRETARSSK